MRKKNGCLVLFFSPKKYHVRKKSTFAAVNNDMFYLLLLCLASGFTQAVLICSGIYMLRHHRDYLFQRIFAAVLIMHSFGFFNNFVVASCWNLPCSHFINTLLVLYDYVIVGGYMMFAVSLVFPNRYSLRQLSLMEVPFLAALIVFAVTGSPVLYPIIQIFTLTASTALLIFLESSVRKHTDMLHDNVGDLERFDLRWSAILLIVLFAVQLLWAFESVSQKTWFSVTTANWNLLFDTLYCLLTIVFVVFVMQRIIRQKVFVVYPEENETTELEQPVEEALSDGIQAPYHKILLQHNIEEIIHEKKYYLETDLTLQKLAKYLGTNRQYLSNYINQEMHKTFYDFINDFRLEEAKRLLDAQSGDQFYSMEEIAMMSGYNTYSTFLRSFKKKYGQSPRDYLKNR